MNQLQKQVLFRNSSEFKASFDSGYDGSVCSNSSIVSREESFSQSVLELSQMTLSSDKSSVSLLYSPFKKLQISSHKRSCKLEISFAETPAKTQARKQHGLNENEFLDVLTRNHKLPSDPRLLIGHCMGIERYDIINELSKRSATAVVSKIISYLSPVDYVNMAKVSREWASIIKNDIAANSKRIRCLKIHERSKENATGVNSAAKIVNKSKRFRPLYELDKNSLDFHSRSHLKRKHTLSEELEFKPHSATPKLELDTSISFNHDHLKRNDKRSTPIQYTKICSRISKSNLKRL